MSLEMYTSSIRYYGCAVLASAALGFYVLKKYRDSKLATCPAKKSLEGKVFLITGGSAGLGKELAVEVAKRGAVVVIASPHNESGAQAVDSIRLACRPLPAKVHWMQLNLENLQAVEAFAEKFKANYDRLDCLVNNAGIMKVPFKLSPNGYEMHFAVNHLGHVCLTDSLLPLLVLSAPSRVVVVTSGKYTRASLNSFNDINNPATYNGMLAYARSKLANIVYARHLSNELHSAGRDVSVIVVRPGFVRGTKLGRHVSRAMRILLYPLIWFFSITPQQAVQNMLYCCTAQLHSGAMYNNCQITTYNYDLVNKDSEEQVTNMSRSIVSAAFGL